MFYELLNKLTNCKQLSGEFLERELTELKLGKYLRTFLQLVSNYMPTSLAMYGSHLKLTCRLVSIFIFVHKIKNICSNEKKKFYLTKSTFLVYKNNSYQI